MEHEPTRSGPGPTPEPGSTRTADPRDDGRPQVLLIEDERLIRLALASALRARGYAVHAAGTAEEALRLPAPLPADLDLVISDVLLPGLSGVELTRRLRERGLRCPVVFMSALSADGLQRVGLGPDALVLTKPFEQEALLDRLEQLLGAA